MRGEIPPRVVGKVSIPIWYFVYLQCFAASLCAVLVNRIEAPRDFVVRVFYPLSAGTELMPVYLQQPMADFLLPKVCYPLSVALRLLRVVRHLSRAAVSRPADTPPGRQSGAFWNCIPAAR